MLPAVREWAVSIDTPPTPEQVKTMHEHAETWSQAKGEAYREIAAYLRRMAEIVGGCIPLEIAASGVEKMDPLAGSGS